MQRLLSVLLLTSSAIALAQPVATQQDKSNDGVAAPIEPTTEGARDPNAPAPEAPPKAPPVKERSWTPVEAPIGAADVKDAPAPGSESGRLDKDPGDSTLRLVGRGLMGFVRLPVEVLAQPIRGVFYVKEKYNAIELITNIFTTDDRKIAVFPTAFVETGFGANVGARATFKDLLNHQEKLSLRAGFGGPWRTTLQAKLGSGNLFGDVVSVGIEAKYEKRDNERFYGYGNDDEVDAPPPMPVDPVGDGLAFRTTYQMEIERVAPHVRVQLPHYTSITATGAYLQKDADDDDSDLQVDETAISSVYQTNTVAGFDRTTKYIYTELEVAYDSRRNGDIYDPPGMRTTGGFAAAFAGRYGAIEAEDRDFYRGGVDLQRVIRIIGPRSITLRAYGEHVTGERGDIPFTELTRLGGYQLLRGYDRDRFRDKTGIVGQASYVWPLGQYVGGNLFVDVGRVYSGLDEITYKNQRVGFGGALEVYSKKSMVIRAELATSIDGGLFGYISLDPAFDAQSRVERR